MCRRICSNRSFIHSDCQHSSTHSEDQDKAIVKAYFDILANERSTAQDNDKSFHLQIASPCTMTRGVK